MKTDGNLIKKRKIKKEESEYEVQSNENKRSFINQHNKRGKWKGKWTLKENQIFLNYLMKKKDTFGNSHDRRSEKIFCKLTHYLGYRRSAQQCRRYFQKICETIKSQETQHMVSYLQEKIRWQKYEKAIGSKKQMTKIGHSSTVQEKRPFYKMAFKEGSQGRQIEIKILRTECFLHW